MYVRRTRPQIPRTEPLSKASSWNLGRAAMVLSSDAGLQRRSDSLPRN